MDSVLNSLKIIGMDTVKTSASVFAVHLTVAPMITHLAGDKNEVLQYSAEGACNAIASDLVDYFVSGQSKIMSGNVVALLDDAVFMGGVSGVCDKSGLSEKAVALIGSTPLPLEQKYQILLAQAGIVSGARELSNIIGRTQLGQNQMVQYVRHPVSTVMGRR
jgi:hypothetical protein